MTTKYLLLSLLVVILSSPGVDSQPTTDDQVCDGWHWSEAQRDITLQRILDNQQQLFELLNNQQQQLQTVKDCLGKITAKSIRVKGSCLFVLLGRWFAVKTEMRVLTEKPFGFVQG